LYLRNSPKGKEEGEEEEEKKKLGGKKIQEIAHKNPLDNKTL